MIFGAPRGASYIYPVNDEKINKGYVYSRAKKR